MDDKKTKGIYGKFMVKRTDGKDATGEKHENCDYFVLDLTHDPYALPALAAYATSCGHQYPELAKDLWAALPQPLAIGLPVNVCDAEGNVVRTGTVTDPGGPDFDLTAVTTVRFEDGMKMYFHPYTLKGEPHEPRKDLLSASGLHLDWPTRTPGWRATLPTR